MRRPLTLPPLRGSLPLPMGEGYRGLFKVSLDNLKDTGQVGQDFVVPEAQDSESGSFQISGSFSVVSETFFSAMLTTIQFNNQTFFNARKISNVWPKGMLTPELHFQPLIPQFLPELGFSFCLIAPQPPSFLSLTSAHETQSKPSKPSPQGRGREPRSGGRVRGLHAI